MTSETPQPTRDGPVRRATPPPTADDPAPTADDRPPTHVAPTPTADDPPPTHVDPAPTADARENDRRPGRSTRSGRPTWRARAEALAARWRERNRERERERGRKRNNSLLAVHDLAVLRGAELDTYIEGIKPPGARVMLPWMTLVIGPAADVSAGRVHPFWLGYPTLALYCVLYAKTVVAAFEARRGRRPRPFWPLLALAAVTYATAIAFGHNWILLFIMLALACGTVLRGRRLGQALAVIAASDGIIVGRHAESAWTSTAIAYGTLLSGLITAAILSLHDVIGQLRATRQELARNAVSQERLRFSRDLHDLLGHTMSVVAVKAEAVRRLAGRDLAAALDQAADIESVARQALTEIREAVSGYREGSLTVEVDRARSALEAAGVALVVDESGPPLPPQTAALLGWVVREGVTNVVRHSGASACRIELRTGGDRATLEITDDGDGSGTGGGNGNGLKGLTERLALAGGRLTAGPAPRGGYVLAADLPVDTGEPAGGIMDVATGCDGTRRGADE
jgi:two-component system sensor histidine kinase DesK